MSEPDYHKHTAQTQPRQQIHNKLYVVCKHDSDDVRNAAGVQEDIFLHRNQ